jgi:hypothetical protein
MCRVLYFFSLILLWSCNAQNKNARIAGKWKSYLADSVTFDYLELNKDGTGRKGFGQTIEGKDSLFERHIATFKITSWKLQGDKLTLQADHALDYSPGFEYKVKWNTPGQIELTGENIDLDIFPSQKNRSRFTRTVRYIHADSLEVETSASFRRCIVWEKPFTYQKADSLSSKAIYRGFDDLIPYLLGCKDEFPFASSYKDNPYSITVPHNFTRLSLGFGKYEFYYTLYADSDPNAENRIEIYYDFDNSIRDAFFRDLDKDKINAKLLSISGKDVYQYINYDGKRAGRCIIGNSLIVAYYTVDPKLEPLLLRCIASFEYR